MAIANSRKRPSVLNESSHGGQPLHIAFVSSHDPSNIRAFSGTIFHMAEALRAGFPEIEFVHSWCPVWFTRFTNIVSKVTKGRANPHFWRPFNKLFAKRLAHRWQGRRVLVIVVVNAALASELAPLVPVMNITDATFELMRQFYAYFGRYSRRAAAVGEIIERRSIQLSAHNSFPSSWAANSAIRHYGAAQEKVSIDAWGSNLAPVGREEVREIETGEKAFRLLFLGAEWLRKGGDVVWDAANLLAQRGVPIQLDLVGSTPTEALPDRPWLRMHGFLSKAKASEADQLRELIRDADLLFLPTRQDTYGMVFGEANAYGTPALTRAVGGVGDVVRDGVNGILLPQDATPSDFADAIQSLCEDRERYRALRESARQEYENRLNWQTWADAIAGRVETLKMQGRA